MENRQFQPMPGRIFNTTSTIQPNPQPIMLHNVTAYTPGAVFFEADSRTINTSNAYCLGRKIISATAGFLTTQAGTYTKNS